MNNTTSNIHLFSARGLDPSLQAERLNDYLFGLQWGKEADEVEAELFGEWNQGAACSKEAEANRRKYLRYREKILKRKKEKCRS